MDLQGRITPVARKTSNDAVYRAILDLIVRGDVLADQRLVERELAGALDVSRTPVREALIRLRRDGFVVATGRRGLAVAPLDVAEGVRLYRLVGALEAHLVEEMDRYPASAALRLLEVEAESRAAVADRSRTIRLGEEWHRLLVDPSVNRIAKRHLDELAVHVRRFEHYFFAAKALDDSPAPADRTPGKAEHGDIARALAAGDNAGAALQVRRHWNRSAERLRLIDAGGRNASACLSHGENTTAT